MPVPPALALRNRIQGHKVLMAMLNGERVDEDARVTISAYTAELVLAILKSHAPEALPTRSHVAAPRAVAPRAPAKKKSKAPTDPRLAQALDIVDSIGFPWYKKLLREQYAAGNTTLVDRFITQKEKCKRGIGKVDWKQGKVFCSK